MTTSSDNEPPARFTVANPGRVNINRYAMISALACWILAILLTVAGYYLGNDTLVELTRQSNALTKAIAALIMAGVVCGSVGNFTTRRPAWLIGAIGQLVCWILLSVLFTGLPGMTIEDILGGPIGVILVAGIVLGFMVSFAPDVVNWRQTLRRRP